MSFLEPGGHSEREFKVGHGLDAKLHGLDGNLWKGWRGRKRVASKNVAKKGSKEGGKEGGNHARITITKRKFFRFHYLLAWLSYLYTLIEVRSGVLIRKFLLHYFAFPSHMLSYRR